MSFEVLLASTGPGLARGERAGGTWRVDNVLDEDVRCLAVDRTSGTAYAGTHGNGLWTSSDAGATWTRAGLEGHIVKSVATTTAVPDLVVAGTKPPMVWVSEDAASTWSEREAFRDIPGRSLWRQPAERPSTAYIQALAISPATPMSSSPAWRQVRSFALGTAAGRGAVIARRLAATATRSRSMPQTETTSTRAGEE